MLHLCSIKEVCDSIGQLLLQVELPFPKLELLLSPISPGFPSAAPAHLAEPAETLKELLASSFEWSAAAGVLLDFLRLPRNPLPPHPPL